MNLDVFLEKLSSEPDSVAFDDAMAVIEQNYDFTETAFSNGETTNQAGQNNGSCKILAFGQLNQLPEDKLLHCFGDYYRNDVLGKPGGDDHQNIRQFMQHGWTGVSFDGQALVLK